MGPGRYLTVGPSSADLAECIGDGRTPVDAVENVASRVSVPRELSSWSANRILYPAVDPSDMITIEGVLSLRLEPGMVDQGWWEMLNSHSITQEMAESFADDDVAGFLRARQQVLERQFDTFLRQPCEWEFEDTPPLDLLVIDDEAEELSDDESAGLR